jgi:hypothetical protein
MDSLPNPFMEAGERSTFDQSDELVTAAKSILEEIVLPVFIADPSQEYLELLEIAA